MIPEIGHFALILALLFAILLASVPFIHQFSKQPMWLSLARPLAFAECIFILIGFFGLMSAFVSNDFSVTYVAENSNSQLPLGYKLAAVWGAHEGSLLLWVTILSLWMSAIAIFSQRIPIETITKILAVLAMISIGFLIFLLAISSPFTRLLPDFPANGRDLNPLLQDPGLASHPPLLYTGYVGFAVPFACVIAALWQGKLDDTWARWSRPWTLLAWAFLTIGIVLGSWWAYRVLGWGGWWFWDPVENASLLPWLVGTALIHSLSVTEKRNVFKAWTAFLAITAFVLSLLGTFLVRSGILVSVHAFAVDPSRGAYLLKFLLLVIASAFTLYAWRGHTLKTDGTFSFVSRECLLLLNNLLLFVITITVLLGTIYPLIIEVLGLGKLSVGAPYFNAVFVPLVTPLIFIMGIGPHCLWQQTPKKQLFKKLGSLFVLCGLVSLGFVLLMQWFDGYLLLGLTLVIWLFAATLMQLIQRIKTQGGITKMGKIPAHFYGMILAHLGIGVCVIGITFTVLYSKERDVEMAAGDSVSLGQYQFQFVKINNLQGPNWVAQQITFAVSKQGKHIANLNPEKRVYTVMGTPVSHAAISANVVRDLYIALGEPVGKNAWSVRIYYKPFVRWIWFGGIMVMLGGLIAALDRRYRDLLSAKRVKA